MSEARFQTADLLNQQTPHPVLQQIDRLNSQFGPIQPILVVDGDTPGQGPGTSKEIADDIGNLAQEGVNESIRLEMAC